MGRKEFMMAENIVWHSASLAKEKREQRNEHRMPNVARVGELSFLANVKKLLSW
jgi:hypothetical protein